MTDDPMLPTTKTELLERMRVGRAAWDERIARVDPETLTEPSLAGGWSAKDLIAHVAAYERWTAAQLRALRTGRPLTNLEQYGTAEPPAGFDALDLDERNAALYAIARDLPMAEAQAQSAAAFAALVAAVEALDEVTLATTGALDWTGDRTLLEILPEQSYDHYAQHADDVQALVDKQGSGAKA